MHQWVQQGSKLTVGLCQDSKMLAQEEITHSTTRGWLKCRSEVVLLLELQIYRRNTNLK